LEADLSESEGAIRLLKIFQKKYPETKKMLVDGGFHGLALRAKEFWPELEIEVIKPDPGTKGFQVLQRRWVVERTFAWMGLYRRLSKEYETHPATSELFMKMAMCFNLVKRLVDQNTVQKRCRKMAA
jgi:transposase